MDVHFSSKGNAVVYCTSCPPGQDEFDAALNSLWKRLLGSGYPERMPQCLLMPGHSIEPWYLWREVWSWGGPDVITDNKVGLGFGWVWMLEPPGGGGGPCALGRVII